MLFHQLLELWFLVICVYQSDTTRNAELLGAIFIQPLIYVFMYLSIHVLILKNLLWGFDLMQLLWELISRNCEAVVLVSDAKAWRIKEDDVKWRRERTSCLSPGWPFILGYTHTHTYTHTELEGEFSGRWAVVALASVSHQQTDQRTSIGLCDLPQWLWPHFQPPNLHLCGSWKENVGHVAQCRQVDTMQSSALFCVFLSVLCV